MIIIIYCSIQSLADQPKKSYAPTPTRNDSSKLTPPPIKYELGFKVQDTTVTIFIIELLKSSPSIINSRQCVSLK